MRERLVFGNFDEGLTALSSAWNSVDIEAGATLDLAGVPSSFNTLAGERHVDGQRDFARHDRRRLHLREILPGTSISILPANVELAGDSTIGNIDIGNGGSLAALTNDAGGFIDLDTDSGISLSAGRFERVFCQRRHAPAKAAPRGRAWCQSRSSTMGP